MSLKKSQSVIKSAKATSSTPLPLSRYSLEYLTPTPTPKLSRSSREADEEDEVDQAAALHSPLDPRELVLARKRKQEQEEGGGIPDDSPLRQVLS